MEICITRRQLFAAILIICLCFSLIPLNAVAVDIVASGACGEHVSYKLDADGLLTISGFGKIFSLDSGHVDQPTMIVSPFSGDSRIRTVVIENGVESIDDYTFSYCAELISVTIPESVTEIGECAFLDCKKLTTVIMEKNNASIDRRAFEWCSSLADVFYGGTEAEFDALFENHYSSFFPNACRFHFNVDSVESHVWSIVVQPTCTENGSVTKHCHCGYEYEPELIPATGHKTEVRNVKAATCDEPGYTGDVVCTICKQILETGKVIPATGHEMELRGAMPATEAAPGYTGDEVCTVCGKIIKHGEMIPKIVPPAPSNPFGDVKDGQYYYDAVLWAVNHKPLITNGTSATTFSPEATCTRAQVVTFLWRAAGEPEPKSMDNPFTDVSKAAYYNKAVLWAVEQGITNGTSKTTFSPNEPCTRAHVVTFLWRFEHEPDSYGSNPFKDVGKGQYYTFAVLWAVSAGITNGTSATTFSPNGPCTRGQIVTFLYRDMK